MLSRAVLLGMLLVGFAGQQQPGPSPELSRSVAVGSFVDITIDLDKSRPVASQVYEQVHGAQAGPHYGDVKPLGERVFRYKPRPDVAKDVEDQFEVETKPAHGVPTHTVLIKVKISAAKPSGAKTQGTVEQTHTDETGDSGKGTIVDATTATPAGGVVQATAETQTLSSAEGASGHAAASGTTGSPGIAGSTRAVAPSGPVAATGNSGDGTEGSQHGLSEWLRYDRLVPAASALLALLAIIWAFVIRGQAKKLEEAARIERANVAARLRTLDGELDTLKDRKPLAAQEPPAAKDTRSRKFQEEPARRGGTGRDLKIAPKSRTADSEYSPSQWTPPSSGSAGTTAESERPGVLRPSGRVDLPPQQPAFSDSARQFSSDAFSYPATPLLVPQPSDRLEKSGDVVADFNRAQAKGHDGYQWFLASYNFSVLSCKNLNERKRDPGAELRFNEDPRGHFIGVSQDGQTLLLPAINNDLDSAQYSLDGAFRYLGEPDASFRLLKAGVLRADGVEWVLARDGEIGRG